MSESDFDDYPETHLDDDEYDEFVASEFDDKGRLKGTPPVPLIIGLIVVAILMFAVVLLR